MARKTIAAAASTGLARRLPSRDRPSAKAKAAAVVRPCSPSRVSASSRLPPKVTAWISNSDEQRQQRERGGFRRHRGAIGHAAAEQDGRAGEGERRNAVADQDRSMDGAAGADVEDMGSQTMRPNTASASAGTA